MSNNTVWSMVSARPAIAAAVVTLSALGCSPESATADAVAGTTDAPRATVVRGTLEEGNADGVVLAGIDSERDGYTECSGVMLNPNWMLTAKHCVDAPNSSWVRVFAAAQPSPMKQFELWPRTEYSSVIYKHPTEDVALVYFQKADPYYTLSYSNPIHQGSDASLVGKTVTCYGYGFDGAGGEARVRSAAMVVTETSYSHNYLLDDRYRAHGFFMPTNQAGQVLSYGDSGGPCFVNVGGARFLAGVTHSVTLGDGGAETGNYEAGAEYFRDWVYQITGTVAGQTCSMESSRIQLGTTSAAVTWTTSNLAQGKAEYSLDGATWTSAQCKMIGIQVPCWLLTGPKRSALFSGLRPGTTYRYRAGGSCFPFVKEGYQVLAPIVVYQYGSFTTLP